MTGVREAIEWSGMPVVSLFCVADAASPSSLTFSSISDSTPARVRRYPLEDPGSALKGRLDVFEYDVEFQELPDDLRALLEALLRDAIDGDCRLAWLGFEGSFDFDHLLTEDIADQIYGIGVEGMEPIVVLDQECLRSPEWRERLAEARRLLC